MVDVVRQLPDGERRGRPDIVHYFLLSVLESPAGKEGLVDVYVHTYGGQTFYVEPETRIPRSYARFIGIVSKVLRGEDTPRIHPLEAKPDDIIVNKRGEGFKIIVLDENGRMALPEQAVAKDTVAVIGGFQRGSFKHIYPTDDRVKIYDGILPAWAVGSEVVAGWERRFLYGGL